MRSVRTASAGVRAAGAWLSLAVALGGCAVHATPDVGYVEVSSAPIDVRGYPYAFYDDRVVYYVGDRWMYNDGGRWFYYVNEPAPLHRHRVYVQQAPPAYSYPRAAPPAYSYPRAAPPAYGSPRAAPPRAAPPAYGSPRRRPHATHGEPRVAPPAAPPARRIP
jgi:hypothetical protein